MLNISHNQLSKKVDLTEFKSGKKIFAKAYYKQFNKFLLAFAIIGFVVLFLPWTQNISGQGQVTTLQPDQRPQTIQSQIPGRIEQWYVREGDSVKKGDTILKISEIKSDYFDDKLVERTNDQIKAKSSSVIAYKGKISALERQVAALQNERNLKLKQAQNKLVQAKLKIKGDSIDVEAARINEQIAKRQYDRTATLEKEGLKAVKDVEEKRLKLQETQAKLISIENKYLANKNNIINAKIELSRTKAAYADKVSKAQSNMFTAQ